MSAPEPYLCEPWPPGQCRVVVDPYRCIRDTGHGGECESYGIDADLNERVERMAVWPEHREFLTRLEAAQ